MNKKRIISIIAIVLVMFVLLSVIAKSFCEPAKGGAASSVTSYVEKNIPKPAGLDVSSMRMSWILLFSKFCGNGATNQQF
jgi:Flp pilus assembly protein CpaB